MAETITDEHLKKAKNLIEKGSSKYSKAQEIDEEFKVGERSAEGCEDAFHSLVELSESILRRHSMTAKGHMERKSKLEKIGRSDLARLYGDAQSDLHEACYYKQQIHPRQERIIEEIKKQIEKETG
ncbi:hypothetical protein AKJ39_05090 [candidate division MSBL1 archaeon SCGC-AAA259J03]|uniref:HEPN domain-containing protein n=1 Tax=candidate division MSBL1 archaeon SCGC-AAA259J03 TaxID=1698269 RepID=A0A656YUG5_9EURY|nr:hypothetical protein AKJ39_05090 [candidate division MSBL1 archaeon SCGC-AAA259J03]